MTNKEQVLNELHHAMNKISMVLDDAESSNDTLTCDSINDVYISEAAKHLLRVTAILTE